MSTNIKENIEVGIDAVTLNIPLRITMKSYNKAPFEFTLSIDEIGELVLTPVSKDAEFISAIIENKQDAVEIKQEVVTSQDGDITIREFSILIKANMLCESENTEIDSVIDEIGQVVICPVSKENSFVTASFEHSLNLVTEDTKFVDYFGYRLVNTGDGWDVYDYNNDLVDNGIATIAEAKIVACTSEIHRLEGLTEDVDTSLEDKDISIEHDEGNEDTSPNNVTAEVIEEEISDEPQDEEEKQRLIYRFMSGDLPLFSDYGKPLESYIHIPELDAKGYSYYYDRNTDAVVSYPVASENN